MDPKMANLVVALVIMAAFQVLCALVVLRAAGEDPELTAGQRLMALALTIFVPVLGPLFGGRITDAGLRPVVFSIVGLLFGAGFFILAPTAGPPRPRPKLATQATPPNTTSGTTVAKAPDGKAPAAKATDTKAPDAKATEAKAADAKAAEGRPDKAASKMAQGQPPAKTEAKPAAEPKPAPKPTPEAKPAPAPKPAAKPAPDAKVAAKPAPDTKVAAKPAPEAKPVAKPAAKPTPEAKPATKPAAPSVAVARPLLVEGELAVPGPGGRGSVFSSYLSHTPISTMRLVVGATITSPPNTKDNPRLYVGARVYSFNDLVDVIPAQAVAGSELTDGMSLIVSSQSGTYQVEYTVAKVVKDAQGVLQSAVVSARVR